MIDKKQPQVVDERLVIQALHRAHGAISAAIEYAEQSGVQTDRPVDYALRGAIQAAIEDLKAAKKEITPKP